MKTQTLKNLRYILLFTMLATSTAKAQPTQTVDTLGVFRSFFNDHGRLWASPIKKPTLKHWLPWAGIGVATGLSIHFDEKIYSEFQSYQDKHHWVSTSSPIITHGGDNLTVVSVAGAFLVSGWVFKNEKAKQTGFMTFQAIGHSSILVSFGKFFTSRRRPVASYLDEGHDNWQWFWNTGTKFFGSKNHSHYDAFPSGHTIVAFSTASVIAHQYRDKPWVGVASYALATGVGLSRVTEGTHWLSDVVLGGAMGYAIGRFVHQKHRLTKYRIFRKRPIS